MDAKRCLLCDRGDESVPLVRFEFRGAGRWICTEHLPILIHDPARLADRLEAGAKDPGRGERGD